MSNQAIFIFTIGPVQSFISQARKARDLYAGSYLLAYIMGRTIDDMKNYDKTIDVVFPVVINNAYNIPNRVVAIVKDYDDDKKKNLGSHLENVARGILTEISENLIEKTNKDIKEDLKKLYRDQIASHLEVFWLFHEFENYREGYQEAMKQLSEIKRLKPFHQNTECFGRKCSLNPDKNVLFSNMTMRNNLISIDRDNFPYVLGEKEGLSAMGFVKRVLYLDDENSGEGFQKSFPSVAEIVLRNKLRDKNYVNSLVAIGSENCHFILDVYNGVEVKINKEKTNETDVLKLAKSLVEEIRKEEAITGKRLLTSYYAIVKFDGDNMGDLYKHAILKNEEEFKNFHQVLSKKLCAFAASVKSAVKKEEGEVIYTGGEDFLGFIAIDSLFPVLQRLRTDFNTIDLSEYIDSKLTFSAGIAIAHVKTPLKQVVNMSDEMEAFAKGIDADKDAFAIAVMKRSGSHLNMRLKFGNKSDAKPDAEPDAEPDTEPDAEPDAEPDTEPDTIETINKLMTSIYDSEISNSFVYRLNEVLIKIKNIDSKIKNDIVKCEIKRQLQRIDEKKDYSGYTELFFEFYQRFDDLESFISGLEILLFLTRGGETDVL